MNVQGLADLFRSDVADVATPYLWSDPDVLAYAADAYSMFVRLTGGIADYTSEACSVAMATGDAEVVLDERILRVLQAFRHSDRYEVKVVNFTDVPVMRDNDYGMLRPYYVDNKPGPVRYLIIGKERNKGTVAQVPVEDDSLDLVIYRLPLVPVTSLSSTLDEIQDIHHFHLLKWMRALAYQKQDAETFDRAKSTENELAFRNYCTEVKREWERYKYKPRAVAYGGY
jgi:hypothetical protein